MDKFHISIIGAGPGGLALAQALKKNGIAFDVYERDPAFDSRTQGYRVRIDSMGQQALAAILPEDLYTLFRKTASNTSTRRLVTPQLKDIAAQVPETWHADTAKESRVGGDLSVNRNTLREILLCGIEGNVHFGHEFEQYRVLEEGRVELIFCNSGSVVTDAVVGADGVNSSIRKQLAPDAVPNDTGAVCIYGKTGVNQQSIPADLGSGTTVIFADGFSVIMEAMRFSDDLSAIARATAPRCNLTATDDYLYWAFIGPRERLCPAQTEGSRVNAETLNTTLARLTNGWHPALQKIMNQNDPSVLSILPVRSGRPDIEWAPGPITLLGDAVHAMSPAGGIGANMALKDAHEFASTLTEVNTMRRTLVDVMTQYERSMRKRALDAIEVSGRGSARLFMKGGAQQ